MAPDSYLPRGAEWVPPPPQVRAGRQPAGALARTRACWQGTLHLPGPTTSSFAHSAPAHPSPSPPLLPGWWLVMQPPPRALGQARGPCSLGRVAGRPGGARACLKGGFGACPLLRCWAPSHLSAPLPPRRGACSGPAPGLSPGSLTGLRSARAKAGSVCAIDHWAVGTEPWAQVGKATPVLELDCSLRPGGRGPCPCCAWGCVPASQQPGIGALRGAQRHPRPAAVAGSQTPRGCLLRSRPEQSGTLPVPFRRGTTYLRVLEGARQLDACQPAPPIQ